VWLTALLSAGVVVTVLTSVHTLPSIWDIKQQHFRNEPSIKMPSTPRRSAYKPRKRHADAEDAAVQAYLTTPKPAFPLVAFLTPARGGTSQWVLIPLILMTVGLFRWAAGLWGYSGFQSPPMHGDFEAQRHWMEITNHLPISRWYFHDLQWWGLDYPPLTAFHSWVLGRMYV